LITNVDGRLPTFLVDRLQRMDASVAGWNVGRTHTAA